MDELPGPARNAAGVSPCAENVLAVDDHLMSRTILAPQLRAALDLRRRRHSGARLGTGRAAAGTGSTA